MELFKFKFKFFITPRVRAHATLTEAEASHEVNCSKLLNKNDRNTRVNKSALSSSGAPIADTGSAIG